MGGAHLRVEASITSPTSSHYVTKQLIKSHGSVPHTTAPQRSSLLHCNNNGILRILVKSQPSTQSTGPRSPTRLGIRSQDLGLPNEYSLGHHGRFAASRRKHYTLLTATDTTALYKTPCFVGFFCFVLFFTFVTCFPNQYASIVALTTNLWCKTSI